MGVMILLLLLPLSNSLSIGNIPFDETKAALSVLDTLPKECEKNGKKYKEGEKFEVGRLRYQCQKHGVYSIEGCRTEKNESIAIGETVVKDNVKHQCLKSGSSIFYRETVCGTLGQPECDKVPKPAAFEKAEKNKPEESKVKKLDVSGLPQGWSVFEEGAKKIPGTNATLIFRTLTYNPMSNTRARRQMGHGVGRVVGMEDPGNEKPPMPMEILGGNKVHSSRVKEKSDHGTFVTKSGGSQSNKSNILYTQDIGASLKIQNPSDFKKGTVSGTHHDVKWSGKTANVGGKPMAVGPGIFTFGGTVHKKQQ